MELNTSYCLTIKAGVEQHSANLNPVKPGNTAAITIAGQSYELDPHATWVQKQFNSLHNQEFIDFDDFKAQLIVSSCAGIEEISAVAEQVLDAAEIHTK